MPAKVQMDALHGLRGLAAVCVMLLHFAWLTGFHIAPRAYTAVDMFFLLSGFVIAHAYDPRFASGMTLYAFAKARLIRLYPLYFLGLLSGIMMTPVTAALGISPGFSRLSLMISSMFGFAFLPTPPAFSADGSLFPQVGPAWSLFWELLANGMFALTALALTKRRLQVIVGTGAIALCFVAWSADKIDGGCYWKAFPTGGIRVWFAFFLGVYIRRHHFSVHKVGRYGGLAFAIVLVMASAALLARPPASYGWIFDLFVVTIVWPALILVAYQIQLDGLVRQVAQISGDVSYATYVLHTPLIALFVGGWSFWEGTSPKELPPAGVAIVALIIMGCAMIANTWYDAPVRRWLSDKGRAKCSVTQF